MIRNIIYSFLFFDLVLALSVLIFWQANGVQPHVVRFGSAFMSFFKTIAGEFSATSFSIPQVPFFGFIPYLRPENFQLIMFITNLGIYVLNATYNLLNFFIWIINCVLDAVRFFFIIFNNFNNFISILKTM